MDKRVVDIIRAEAMVLAYRYEIKEFTRCGNYAEAKDAALQLKKVANYIAEQCTLLVPEEGD